MQYSKIATVPTRCSTMWPLRSLLHISSQTAYFSISPDAWKTLIEKTRVAPSMDHTPSHRHIIHIHTPRHKDHGDQHYIVAEYNKNHGTVHGTKRKTLLNKCLARSMDRLCRNALAHLCNGHWQARVMEAHVQKRLKRTIVAPFELYKINELYCVISTINGCVHVVIILFHCCRQVSPHLLWLCAFIGGIACRRCVPT